MGAMTDQRTAKELLDRMFAVEMEFLNSGTSGRDLLATAFHADVVIHEPVSLPYAGDWRGLDGLAALFRVMNATWSHIEVVGLQAAKAGDLVFMGCTIRLTARDTGVVIEQPFAEMLRFDGGLLIEGTPFYHDTAAIVAALAPGSAGGM